MSVLKDKKSFNVCKSTLIHALNAHLLSELARACSDRSGLLQILQTPAIMLHSFSPAIKSPPVYLQVSGKLSLNLWMSLSVLRMYVYLLLASRMSMERLVLGFKPLGHQESWVLQDLIKVHYVIILLFIDTACLVLVMVSSSLCLLFLLL